MERNTGFYRLNFKLKQIKVNKIEAYGKYFNKQYLRCE